MKSLTSLIPVRQILIVCLLLCNPALATHEIQNASQSSSGIAAFPHTLTTVTDSRFADLPTPVPYVNFNVTDRVELYIDHTYSTYIGTAYSYTFEIELTLYDGANPPVTQNISMPIEFDPNANPGFSYRDKSVYSIEGYYKIEAKVTDVKDASGNSISPAANTPDNITINIVIDAERYWHIPVYVIQCVGVNGNDVNADNIDDEVEVSWPVYLGAEEYDLEWTWIDDYTTTLSSLKSISNISWDFRQDATRITTCFTNYRVNLVYERGYILFRVRPIWRDVSDPTIRYYGSWSVPDWGTNPSSICSPPTYYYVTEDHMGTMNWQYNGVFAEEGKKKEVVNYYDGSLRVRQTVTKINTIDTALARETIYDFIGRKAIEILPVPLRSPALTYDVNLNINSSGNKYSWEDFDQDNNDPCEVDAGQLGTSTGAGYYYSTSNSNHSQFNAYVPDASGFPFSQIEYEPDNTGRIRRQGGVGPDHQLGSTHETKYFYSQPSQEELDRLFGSEVGHFYHYKKNMVLDPNGQKSISYLDQKGQVIATALAGENPQNVTALDYMPENPAEENTDLFGKDEDGKSKVNLPNMDQNAIEFSKMLLVTQAGTHTFNYDVEPEMLSTSTECGSLCFDCVYDLELLIKDECNTIIEQQNVRIGHPVNTSYNSTCAETVYFSEALGDDIELYLEEGTYLITKTLKINQDAYRNYLEMFLDPEENDCIVSFEDLVVEEKLKLDYDGCEISCEECVNALGTVDEYVLAGKGDESDYQREYKNCMEPCSGENLCEMMFHIMLQDMAPGGQYGEYYDSAKKTISISDFPLSIYNEYNTLPNDNGTPFWKNPTIDMTGGTFTIYLNADLSTRSRIELIKNADGTYTPPNSYVEVIDGIEYTYPEFLDNVEDFFVHWQPSWSYSLVAYHPEYCYYNWCNSNLNNAIASYGKTSSEFDDFLLNLDSYMEADDALNGIGSITTSTSIVNKDPYFNDPLHTALKTKMQTKVNDYDGNGNSMLVVAAAMVLCPANYGNPLHSSCGPFGSGTTQEQDEMWSNYRYLYLGAKNDIIAEQADKDINDPSTGCARGINAHIGNENFVFSNSVMTKAQFDVASRKPCTVNTYSLYVNKSRRFDFNASVAKRESDKNKANYNRTYFGRSCPLDLDLVNWLNSLAYQNALESSTPRSMRKDKHFTPEFYAALIAPALPGTSYCDWHWQTAVQTNTNELIGTFTSTAGGSCPTQATCSLHFYLPSGHDWNNESVEYFAKYGIVSLGSLNKFELTARMSTGADVKVLVETCLDIGSCTFQDDCNVTDYGNSLGNLLSALAANTSHLNSTTAVNLETNYPRFVTRFIRNNIGSSSSNNLEWIASNISNGDFKIRQSGSTNSSDDINIHFYNYSSSVWNQMKYFTDFKYDPTNLSGYFSMTGWYGTTAPYTPVTVDASISRGVIGVCYDPVPVTCEVTELQATRDFEALIRNIITTHPTINQNLLLKNEYTRILEAYVGKGVSTTLIAPTYSDNEIKTYIEVSDGGQIINKCIIQLYRKKTDYLALHGSLGSIIDIGLLHTDVSGMPQGKTNHFTMVAKFPGGQIEEILGYVSCIPLSDCIMCEKPEMEGECPTYDWYVQEVTYFNQTFGQNVTIVANDDIFPCNCVKNYLYYLRAFALITEPPTPYNIQLTCTSPTTPYDIHDFSGDYGCEFKFCDNCILIAWTTPPGGSPEKGWASNEVKDFLWDMIGDFNSQMSNEPWFETVYISPDDVAADDCGCAIKYAVYLNRWLNKYNTEEPDMAPDFAPVDFKTFKEQGCDADCWWEYQYYKLKSQNASAIPAGYTSTVDCECWLQFADHVNLSTHTPAQLIKYCSNKPAPVSDIYKKIDWDDPIPIRKKNLTSSEDKYRDVNECNDIPMPEYELENPCTEWLDSVAKYNAQIRYLAQMDTLTTHFNKLYHNKCMSAEESFTMEYLWRDYHFTLYYYDQAGNLVRTVPPEGVRVLTNSTELEKVKKDRTNGTQTGFTSHILNTVYEYNSLNQLVKQSVPDHDKMDIWTVSETNGVPDDYTTTDIQFLNANAGLMAGNINGQSQLLKSEDGGQTWSRETDIWTNDITKVAMADNDVGYAIGKGGILLKTLDKGNNWRIVAPSNFSPVNDWKDIVVRKNGAIYEGYIIEDIPNIGSLQPDKLRTFSDNGTFTISAPVSGLPTADFKSITFKETVTGTGFLLVDDGTNHQILKCSTWVSPTWTSMTIASKTRSANLSSAYMISSTLGYLGGEDGVLLKTVDGGDNWSLLETNVIFGFKQLFFPSSLSGKGIALANTGDMYKTDDGGNTWTQATALGDYNAFHFWDKSNGYGFGVGEDGLISRIRWKLENSQYVLEVNKLSPAQSLTHDFTAVYFASATDGIVAGKDSKIYKVTDGDKNLIWYPINNYLTGDYTSVYYPSSGSFTAVTINGNLYKIDIGSLSSGTYPCTNCSGAPPTPTASTGYFRASGGESGSNVYFMSYASSTCIIKKYNSSLALQSTYTSLAISGDDGPITAFSDFNSGNLIAAGEKGTIYKYVSSWSDKSKNVNPGGLNKVKAVGSSSNELWLLGNDGNLFLGDISTGIFKQKPTGIATDLKVADFIGTSEGFVAGNENRVLNITTVSSNLVITPRSTGFDDAIQDIVSWANGEAYFITDCKEQLTDKMKGAILYTNNGGATFTGKCPRGILKPGTSLLCAVKCSTTYIIGLGKGGTAVTNNGTSYFGPSYLYPPTIKDIHVNPINGAGMIVGKYGATLRTDDNGKNWNYNGQTSTLDDLNKVWVSSTDLAYVVGNNGFAKTMKTSMVNSVDFDFYTAPVGSPDFNAVVFNEDGTGLLAGEQYVYRFNSSDSKWYEKVSLTNYVFRGADAQGDYAIVAGVNGSGNAAVYTSSNFNSTGSFASATLPVTTALYNVTMYDRSRAYITGAGGLILKTVNHGGTWVQKTTGLSQDLYTLALNKRYHLVFGGAPPTNDNSCRQVSDHADFISSRFWYDEIGRLTVSQNTKQYNKTPDAYSYTLYDALGRITEVGEKENPNLIETTLVRSQIDPTLFDTWITYNDPTTRREVTQTFYDEQFSGVSNTVINQQNMVKRVASVTYEEAYDGDNTSFDNATHYTYDIHGNVNHLVQDIPELSTVNQQYKHIYYDYDLISGNVNLVEYNPGGHDQYYQRYAYDADNRITDLETSRDGVIWDRDATYEYYRHGPLARKEIGDLKVQGLDYVYTIQGWLKGVNSNTMDETRDPGRDGDNTLTSNIHEAVSRDAFGFTLGYYAGDYSAIKSFSTTQKFEAQTSGSDMVNYASDLWNGNIGHMVTCLPLVSDYNASFTITPEALGNGYKYDQLNRLKSSRTFFNYASFTHIDYSNNVWNNIGNTPDDYATDYSYDAMGNIKTQKRNGRAPLLALDDLTYNYNYTSVSPNVDLISNRLYSVDDAVTGAGSSNYTDDIEDQGTFNNNPTLPATVNTANNYGYDEVGNLVRDDAEDISNITWTVYGKIKSITNTGTRPNLEFGYDAGGNRLWKKVTPKGTNPDIRTYYYLRDASGNEMCRYVKYEESSTLFFVSREHAMYGSAREGMDNRWDTLYKNGTYNHARYSSDVYIRDLGLKYYEMSNHLGNVLVTETDKKVYVSSGLNVDYFESEITSISDYYPFGSPMVVRTWTVGSIENYRYGFEGQEKDDEIKGDGNSLNFAYRVHDPRLGRFLSVDPLTASYPHNSPYAFAENRVIDGFELEGLEWAPTKDKEGNVTDYTWKGYNADGTAPEGTVAGGTVTNGKYQMTFSSNAERRTGLMSATYIGKGYEMPGKSGSASEYNFKFGLAGNSAAYNVSDAQGSLATYTYGGSAIGSSGSSLIYGAREELGLNFHPATGACTPVYPELYLMPLPKLGVGARLGKFFFGARVSAAFGRLTLASEYGIAKYSVLRALTKGAGVEVHHLIEKRFAGLFGLTAKNMPSIVVTKAEHLIFTRAWRNEIGYAGSKAAVTTLNATKAQVEAAARKIYKDYPEILKALGL